MNKIKFSDDYEKLPKIWQNTKATLLSIVAPIDIEELKNTLPAFITYDTKYRLTDGVYDLNFKTGIILILIHHNTGIPFTTIRRYTTQKYRYYHDQIGETFQIIWEKK